MYQMDTGVDICSKYYFIRQIITKACKTLLWASVAQVLGTFGPKRCLLQYNQRLGQYIKCLQLQTVNGLKVVFYRLPFPYSSQ